MTARARLACLAGCQLAMFLALASAVPASVVPLADQGDFGVVIQGDTARVRFLLHNRGGTSTRIEMEPGQCHCFAIDPLTLAPGEQGALEVALDTSSLESFVLRQVTVRETATDRSITLTLRGVVLGPFSTAPRFLEFADNETARLLEVRGETSFRISDIHEASGALSIERVSEHGEATLHRFAVSVTDEQPHRVEGSVVVEILWNDRRYLAEVPFIIDGGADVLPGRMPRGL